MEKLNDKKKWLFLSMLSIILISAVTYLPKVTGLGFYRDDWYLLYGGNTFGAERFNDIFASDRPFRGLLMSNAFALFRNRILLYNIADYFLRVLGALVVMWLVKMTWPKQKMAAFLTAVLFVVYPAFTDMPNALDFQAHLISITAMIFSIALSVRSLSIRCRSGKIFLVTSAIIFALLSMFGMEYYIGLEGLRILLIWYNTGPKGWQNALKKVRKRLLRFLGIWWPYAISSGSFMVWRLFLFENERYSTNIDSMFTNYLSSPLLRLAHTFSDMFLSVINITFLAWSVPFNELTTSLRLRDWTFALLMGGIAATILIGFFLVITRRGLDENVEQPENKNWARDAVIIGLLSITVAMIPIIFGDRIASLPSRFTLPGAIGGCLTLVGLMYWIISVPIWRYVVTIGLVTLAVMTHYGNSMNYVYDWETARSVWWQLSWRAPQIQPGAVLVSQLSGVSIPEDYVIWGPANLIYYPEPVEGQIPLSAEVLNMNTQRSIEVGLDSERVLRSFPLVKNFSNTLVLSKPNTDSCLHVIDGEHLELSLNESERIVRVGTYSKIDLIMVNEKPHIPPESIFGPEPEHDWCYYYQKASLARQLGDWKEVARLGDEVRRLSLKTNDWTEWFLFVQAKGYLGDYEFVNEIAPLLKYDFYVHQQTCRLLSVDYVEVGDLYPNGFEFLIETFCN